MALSDACFEFLAAIESSEFNSDIDDAVDELARSAKWYQGIDNENSSNSEKVVYELGETEALIKACGSVKDSSLNALDNLLRLALAILHFHDTSTPDDELTTEMKSAIAPFD